jgi:hypothetical protein
VILVLMVSLEIRLESEARRLRVRNVNVMGTLTRMPFRTVTPKLAIASNVSIIPEMVPRISASSAKLVSMVMPRHTLNLGVYVSITIIVRAKPY